MISKRILSLFAILSSPVLLAGSCDGGGDEPAKQESITFSPTELSCTAAGGSLTLAVNASGAFQAFPADGCEWVTVDPSYSAAKTANITVKVGENASYKDRTTEITLKCGTTRVKIPLTQKAIQKGELDIDVPEGYHLDWHDEFDTDGAPSSSDWKYETGGGGWGNNEIQIYAAGSHNGQQLAEISDGSLKIKAMKISSNIYSIRMNTKRYWTYGWFEARLKVSDVPGAWPAFWMMPQNFTTWPGDGGIRHLHPGQGQSLLQHPLQVVQPHDRHPEDARQVHLRRSHRMACLRLRMDCHRDEILRRRRAPLHLRQRRPGLRPLALLHPLLR